MLQHSLLIVDDEKSFLNSIARALRKEPYSLELASNGTSALQILKEKHISIMVTDLKMPGMDGLELLHQVRTHYPHVLTIMLTAIQDLGVAMHAINEIGVYKFFLKPLELNLFKISIQRAMETLDLRNDNDHLLKQVKTRDFIIGNFERQFPGILTVQRDSEGYYIPEQD